jgi:hypothetical protein
MKKLSVIVLVLLLVSVVSYGQESGWTDDGPKVGLTTTSDEVGIGVTGTIYPKLHVQDSKSGPTDDWKQSVIYGYNTATSYDPIGVFGRVNRSSGKAIYGYNENENGYGGYFVGKGYFSGNVGIGTTSPEALLHVYKEGTNTHAQIIIQSDWEGYGKVFLTLDRPNNGRQALIEYKANGNLQWAAGTGLYNNGNPSLGYGISTDGTLANAKILIDTNGYVGIGTPYPQSKLAVNGKITAKEIKVTLNGWSDFVFSEKHKLMPLDKLEEHIKEEKSLPGIPTEKEVLAGGVNLGEMQAKLLEKIEELTLYVIELKKENEELKKRIYVLEK